MLIISSGSRNVIQGILLAALALGLLSACGSNGSLADTASHGSMSASVTFEHSPAGLADLTWNPATHALAVNTMLQGLVPGSKHSAHLHVGSCAKEGEMLYGLGDVVADQTGSGHSTSTINNVANGIPAAGWSISVHNESGAHSDEESQSIGCGNIINSNHAITDTQKVQVTLGPSSAANQSVSGDAQLTLTGSTLTVTLSLQGLAPKTTHAAHIHSGSCGEQGNVLYPLMPVVADAAGKSTIKTTIAGVSSLPDNSWYINVYLTKDMVAQADPIACGDVLVSH